MAFSPDPDFSRRRDEELATVLSCSAEERDAVAFVPTKNQEFRDRR
jgi:hypothetical protein